MPYAAVVVPSHNAHRGQGLEDSHSGLLEHLTPEAAGVIARMIGTGDIMIMQF